MEASVASSVRPSQTYIFAVVSPVDTTGTSHIDETNFLVEILQLPAIRLASMIKLHFTSNLKEKSRPGIQTRNGNTN